MVIRSRMLTMFGICAAVLALSVASSYAQQTSPVGKIDERPSAPQTAGGWKIGGVDYTITSITQFDQTEAALVVGACAAVEFTTAQSGEKLATKITGRAGSC